MMCRQQHALSPGLHFHGCWTICAGAYDSVRVQIAIFVLPVMVLVGWAIGKSFLLDFEPFAALVLTLSVIHTYFVSSDGNSNWWDTPVRPNSGLTASISASQLAMRVPQAAILVRV
jgi:hypothetical protein